MNELTQFARVLAINFLSEVRATPTMDCAGLLSKIAMSLLATADELEAKEEPFLESEADAFLEERGFHESVPKADADALRDAIFTLLNTKARTCVSFHHTSGQLIEEHLRKAILTYDAKHPPSTPKAE